MGRLSSENLKERAEVLVSTTMIAEPSEDSCSQLLTVPRRNLKAWNLRDPHEIHDVERN
jgi:hypothetical protein